MPSFKQPVLHTAVGFGDNTMSAWNPPSPACAYYETSHPVKGYVQTQEDGVEVYYEVHGLEPGMTLEQAAHRPKVVMLMGLACGCSAWRWQLQDLVQQHRMMPDYVGGAAEQQQQHLPQQQQQQQQQQVQHQLEQPAGLRQLSDPDAQRRWQHQHAALQPMLGRQQEMLVCVIDNRGVGNSSSPAKPDAYTTQLMAQDALTVMDHLRWEAAHILGFSMGGMIGQRLAVMAPRRVLSLTLLASSAGGMQIVPLNWHGLRIALKMVMARTPEDAVDATLRMHFRRRTLKAWVSHLSAQRQELLKREYLTPTGGPPQPAHGFKGQMSACWKHRLSDADAQAIVQAGFPVLVIHGRNDKLASAAKAEALARRLNAPCVILPGAHFIVRECAGQINMLLSSLVLGPRHITSVANAPYLDPIPAVQRSWCEAGCGGSSSSGGSSNGKRGAAGGTALVLVSSAAASSGSSSGSRSAAEFDLGKLK